MSENQSVRNIFLLIGVSYWQTLLILLLVIFLSAAMIIFWRKTRNTSKVILLSLAFSLIIGAVILIINYFYGDLSYDVIIDGEIVTWTLKQELNNLLSLIGNIYLSLIFIMIPFFIFFMIIQLIVEFNVSNKVKFFTKTLFALLIPIIIGMAMAILLIPFIKNINLVFNENIGTESYVVTIPSLISIYFLSAGTTMINIIPVIIIVIISIIVGFATKQYVSSKNNEDLYKTTVGGLDSIKNIILNYLKIVMFLLPFVILTRFSSLFLTPSQFKDLLFFTLVFLGGLFVIILILNIINLMLVKNRKNYFKKYFSYLVIVLSKGNTINYLPETIKMSNEIGVSKANSEFTSTLGLNIGPAICSGYYLMLIALVGMNQIEAITFLNVFFIFFLVLVINFTTSGIKGGDEIARNMVLTTLSSAFGVDPLFYYGSIFAIEAILEPIRHLGNSTSYITSNLISDKLNKEVAK